MAAASHHASDHLTPIRDAACLILVDRSGNAPRVLLGRRLPTQVFLPNKWVFPGGRVDDDDRRLAEVMTEASGISRSAFMLGGQVELYRSQIPFVLSAIRELLEETGLLFGTKSAAPPNGLPPAWQAIADLGFVPRFEGIRPLARAITPPGFPRRFDTWFFLADWQAATPPVGLPDGEFSALDWFTLDAARNLELPLITRLIVDDVAMRLADGTLAEIPFYFQDGGDYRRELLPAHNEFWPP